MYNVVKKTAGVILALLLAFGWIWTVVLYQRKNINEDTQFWILVSLTLILLLQQIYVAIPKPIERGIISDRREINEICIQFFWSEYCKILRELDKISNIPPVRISVMLPTKRFRGLLGSYLEVYYHRYFSEEFPYLGNQLSVTWKKGYGVCGDAWKKNRITFYDSIDTRFQTSAYKLSDAHKKATRDIVSIVSVPIEYKEKVVGVINIDSNEDMSHTKFNNPEIYIAAGKFAHRIASLFDKNGVSA